MRRTEVDLLDRDLDDDPAFDELELGLGIDRTRAELELDGDLGLRSLYERPEAVIGRWPDAA